MFSVKHFMNVLKKSFVKVLNLVILETISKVFFWGEGVVYLSKKISVFPH